MFASKKVNEHLAARFCRCLWNGFLQFFNDFFSVQLAKDQSFLSIFNFENIRVFMIPNTKFCLSEHNLMLSCFLLKGSVACFVNFTRHCVFVFRCSIISFWYGTSVNGIAGASSSGTIRWQISFYVNLSLLQLSHKSPAPACSASFTWMDPWCSSLVLICSGNANIISFIKIGVTFPGFRWYSSVDYMRKPAAVRDTLTTLLWVPYNTYTSIYIYYIYK